ncbi:hypothetical protein [Actinophytocola sp.]|uniref:hypothetical protein n=1 Tax=Actinophytocola sp. TaxID=1872138 RepID=UPI00389A2E95
MSTGDLERSVTAYRDGLGFGVVAVGVIDDRTAARWLAPAVAGAPYVTVASASGVGGVIQMVEGAATPGYLPMRSFGWAALELSVADVDVVFAGLGAGFTTLRAPAPLTGRAGAVLRSAQVAGPTGEVLYLTEIRGELPPFELPGRPDPGVGAVDGVYGVVYAAEDLELARTWWEETFSVRRCSDRFGAIGVLNQAFGLPASAVHRLSSVQLAGRNLVEINQYPPLAVRRPVLSGALPPGVAVVVVDAPKSAPRVLVTPDGAILELRPSAFR